jgi:hypothetical protein
LATPLLQILFAHVHHSISLVVVVARKVVEEKEESGRVSEGASKHE